jgi:hypothetical protein
VLILAKKKTPDIAMVFGAMLLAVTIDVAAKSADRKHTLAW